MPLYLTLFYDHDRVYSFSFLPPCLLSWANQSNSAALLYAIQTQFRGRPVIEMVWYGMEGIAWRVRQASWYRGGRRTECCCKQVWETVFYGSVSILFCWVCFSSKPNQLWGKFESLTSAVPTSKSHPYRLSQRSLTLYHCCSIMKSDQTVLPSLLLVAHRTGLAVDAERVKKDFGPI